MRLLEDGDALVVEAPAKLNVFLEVVGRRDDGYHEVDTILQALTLHDRLVMRPAERGIRLEVVGADLPADERNIVWKAARRLAGASGHGGGVDIRLEKRIPVGAGMGGGSSDGAATLVALSRLWGLPYTREALCGFAAELGSDVPFFLFGGTARCRGRGELVTPVAAGVTPGRFHYVVYYPGFPAPTAAVYRGLGWPLKGTRRIDSIRDVDLWDEIRSGRLFYNRLEESAFRLFPGLERVKRVFEGVGFAASVLCGSGSAIAGLCGEDEGPDLLAGRLEEALGAGMRGEILLVSSEPREGAQGETTIP